MKTLALLLLFLALSSTSFSQDISGNIYTNTLQNRHVATQYGYNAHTGSQWSGNYTEQGMDGVDSRGNYWTYNRSTGVYVNYGTGEIRYHNPAYYSGSSPNITIDQKSALIIGGAIVGVGLAALIYKAFSSPSDSQKDKFIDKYTEPPSPYTQQWSIDIRRNKSMQRLSEQGIEYPANITVAGLQDIESRIKWAKMYNLQCKQNIAWNKFPLVEIERMALSTSCP